nr:hypothetical protein [Tanacetum cinerariifolium]
NDQDSLNSAAGGNFLDKMPRECLKIIKSKSKVRQSRAKAVVAKVSTSYSTPTISSEVSELKDLVRALLLDKKNQSSAPAQSSTPTPIKAIEPNCVTCGGAHSYQNCLATSGNVYRDNIQENDHAHSKQERWGKGAAGKKSAVYRVGELVELIGLSSVISIDLADQVFEGIGARQLVVKKEPAFFNPPEEKVLLYTHRGELPGKLLKDEAVIFPDLLLRDRGRKSFEFAMHYPVQPQSPFRPECSVEKQRIFPASELFRTNRIAPAEAIVAAEVAKLPIRYRRKRHAVADLNKP